MCYTICMRFTVTLPLSDVAASGAVFSFLAFAAPSRAPFCAGGERPWKYCTKQAKDFWKIRKCDEVNLFAHDKIHVDLIDVNFYPTANKNSNEDYSKAITELIDDLSDKYGKPKSVDTLRKDKEYYCLIHTAHAENDIFYVMEWNIYEDKLLLVFNNSRGYIVQMRYISKERIRRINESLKFRGKGAADL